MNAPLPAPAAALDLIAQAAAEAEAAEADQLTALSAFLDEPHHRAHLAACQRILRHPVPDLLLLGLSEADLACLRRLLALSLRLDDRVEAP